MGKLLGLIIKNEKNESGDLDGHFVNGKRSEMIVKTIFSFQVAIDRISLAQKNREGHNREQNAFVHDRTDFPHSTIIPVCLRTEDQ